MQNLVAFSEYMNFIRILHVYIIFKVLIDNKADVTGIMRNTKGDLMTPLDAALFRGNRGCAKYIQLHGGVPAAKLTDKAALQKALAR